MVPHPRPAALFTSIETAQGTPTARGVFDDLVVTLAEGADAER